MRERLRLCGVEDLLNSAVIAFEDARSSGGWGASEPGENSAIEAPAFNLHLWVIVPHGYRLGVLWKGESEAYGLLSVTPGSNAGHSGLQLTYQPEDIGLALASELALPSYFVFL